MTKICVQIKPSNIQQKCQKDILQKKYKKTEPETNGTGNSLCSQAEKIKLDTYLSLQ